MLHLAYSIEPLHFSYLDLVPDLNFSLCFRLSSGGRCHVDFSITAWPSAIPDIRPAVPASATAAATAELGVAVVATWLAAADIAVGPATASYAHPAAAWPSAAVAAEAGIDTADSKFKLARFGLFAAHLACLSHFSYFDLAASADMKRHECCYFPCFLSSGGLS